MTKQPVRRKLKIGSAAGAEIPNAQRKIFMDGSNILLSLLHNGKPSLAAFITAYSALKDRGFDVYAIFDQSVRYRLEEKNAGEEWPKLEDLVHSSSGKISLEVNADPHLLSLALSCDGLVANHSDRYTKWKQQFGRLPAIIRVSLLAESISFSFDDDSVIPFAVTLDTSITLFVDVPASSTAITLKGANMAEKLLTSRNRSDMDLTARLVVFALDSSGSMFNATEGALETHDGRPKSAHLLEIFRGVVEVMVKSNVSSSFYCAVIPFAGSADIQEIAGHRMVHVTQLNEFFKQNPTYDYSTPITNGSGTNISAAIGAAGGVIRSVLVDPNISAIEWSATIILITDGKDGSPKQVKLAAADLADFADRRVKKVELACVAIGDGADFDLLTNIASSPAKEAVMQLQQRNLLTQLPTRPDGSCAMAIKVNMEKSDYAATVRGFIDVASKTF